MNGLDIRASRALAAASTTRDVTIAAGQPRPAAGGAAAHGARPRAMSWWPTTTPGRPRVAQASQAIDAAGLADG